jgi:2-polyprenyl-6-methoxyphenol hydroxylase-like FAD-dependent oxidoreductase
MANGRVTFRERLEVVSLAHSRDDDGSATVTGVRLATPGCGGIAEQLDADLVVDATGRGSRTPVWLTEMGYERPAEDRIAVRIKYASQLLGLKPDRTIQRFVIEGRSPARPFGAALFTCEHDTAVFTVTGPERNFPTRVTREDLLEIAEGVLPDDAMAAIRAADQLSPVSTHQHPASVRRRYDLLADFPSRLIVLGDAMCAFNPIYGQGMSVAAQQALVLRRVLSGGRGDVAKRYLRESARPTANAWQLAAGSDLAYPEVEGNPNLPMRVIGRYINRVLAIAERDPEVARRFLEVAGLVAPPNAVFAPRVLGPVLWSVLAGRRATPATSAGPATGRPGLEQAIPRGTPVTSRELAEARRP